MVQTTVSRPKRTASNSKMLREFWDRAWKESDPYTALPQVASSFFNLDDAKRMLDVGCGNMIFEPVLVPGRLVVGIDISPVALGMARENNNGLARTAKFGLVQARADELPFKDGSFDVVMALETMSLMGDTYDRVLREIARVSSQTVVFNVTHRNSKVTGLAFKGMIKPVSFNEREVEKSIQKAGLKLELLKTFTADEFDNWYASPNQRVTTPGGRKKLSILAIARK